MGGFEGVGDEMAQGGGSVDRDSARRGGSRDGGREEKGQEERETREGRGPHAVPDAMALRSAFIIISTSSSKPTLGFQPRRFMALAGLPSRRSTSAGR